MKNNKPSIYCLIVLMLASAFFITGCGTTSRTENGVTIEGIPRGINPMTWF